MYSCRFLIVRVSVLYIIRFPPSEKDLQIIIIIIVIVITYIT